MKFSLLFLASVSSEAAWYEGFLQKARAEGIAWFWKLAAAIAILAIGHWASKFLVSLTERFLSKTRLDATLRKFFCRVMHAFMLLTVALAVLDTFGVQTASLVAILGTVGLAIGLALQGALSNFAAGVMLVVLRPFKVDDFVEVGGTSGTVEEIGVFSIVLRTGDNRTIIVPNSTFINQAITNATARAERRIDLTIGISYDDNIQVAREIILRALRADKRVLTTREPLVAVGELGENSVDILVRPWVKTGDYWSVRSDLLEKIKDGLEAGGCTIPFPQREVRLLPQKPASPPADSAVTTPL
ncbi:MAG: mechanosensitive ion channel family protein [Puniceicoccales bacterium]|jgi:small conductance mechanosensitive channel|nr:mechanosensitive ion channel family protein [Puniceicoccales bacterium]